MARKNKDANYDFERQKDPSVVMGQGDYANMPDRPIYKTFAKLPSYRDGLIESYVDKVEEVSGIHENQR